MMRWLALAAFVALAAAVLYFNQRRHQPTRVGPEAVLAVAAEAQHELSRVPARITRLSDADETKIGNQLATRYSYREKPINKDEENDDAQVEQYVNEVGSQLVAHARRKLHYRFHYLPDANMVNAFALPGGHIFIGKGLMKLMNSEDELAIVLGHEIEHVEHYHCNEKAQLEAIQQRVPLGSLVTLPIELFEAGYSKDQELEADRDGTQLAVLAGYSPQGAIHMFEAFAKLERQYVKRAETPDQELSQVAIGSIIGYFRSHPLPEEREQQIRRMIVSQGWPAREERALKVLLA